MTTVKQKLCEEGIKRSANKFEFIRRYCEPEMKGRIIPIEGISSELAQCLDYAGIDYFYIRNNSSEIVPVTSRVQEYDNFCTFTVRESRKEKPLEYHKWNDARSKQVKRVYPQIMIQAYLRSNGDIDVGIASVNEILDYIDSNKIKLVKNPEDNTLFYPVPWDKISMLYEFTISATKSSKVNP